MRLAWSRKAFPHKGNLQACLWQRIYHDLGCSVTAQLRHAVAKKRGLFMNIVDIDNLSLPEMQVLNGDLA